MRKPREAVSVRIDAESYKYLKLFAESYGLSITDALAAIIREHEHADPMTFKILHVIAPFGPGRPGIGDEIYDVNVDGASDPICEGPTFEAASEALANLRKENGYDPRRFKLQKEIEVVDLRDEPLPPVKRSFPGERVN
jgi:hypothetical protein